MSAIVLVSADIHALIRVASHRCACSRAAIAIGSTIEFWCSPASNPPGAATEFRLVFGEACEILAVAPHRPRLFDRSPALMARRDVQVARSKRPEKPLVPHGHHEVGVECLQVERNNAERLAGVDDESRIHRPCTGVRPPRGRSAPQNRPHLSPRHAAPASRADCSHA